MGEIKLKCRFLTPAFIYGDNNQLELRASSIKGLIRFWWRAVNKFENIEQMRNEEDKIVDEILDKLTKENNKNEAELINLRRDLFA